jgi:cytochrome c556
LVAGIASMLLSACNSSPEGAVKQAEATGNAAGAAATKAGQPSAAAPLAKDEALALMKRRHENFEEIGDAMKLISRELKAESPDLARMRTGAAKINELAPQVPSWFPPGTGPDVGKTEAKAEIWQKSEDFAAKAQAFREAATAFNTAAQGSDLAAIQPALVNLGKSCKACHDLYREEE